MILEVLRVVADHLADPVHGVAAQLATIPRDAGDAVPTAPTIADESRSLAVALGRPPATLPAITVMQDGLVDLDPRQAQRSRDGQVAIVLRYCVKEGARDDAATDALLVMRACELALDALPLPRTRQRVEVYAVTDLQIGAGARELGTAWALRSLRAVFQARDTLSPV